MTITIRCAFKEDNKLYPQVFLDDTLYTKELKFQKKLMLIRQINQKNVCFVIIGIV